MGKTLRITLGILITLIVGIAPVYSTFAGEVFVTPQNHPVIQVDPHTMVCRGLSMTGIACGSQIVSPNAVGTYKPKPILLNFDVLTPTSRITNPDRNEDLKTVISNARAPRSLTGQKINLVSVPGSSEVYELVNGQKHAFPSLAIFYDYGYTTDMIQPIDQFQLDKYPRAKLLKVQGDSKVYYLTEGGMVRQVIDTKKIFEFYGDRKEDIITVTRKEFNFYPTNEYIYQISPLNRDVFQINGKGKRYLTPMAVARLGIRSEQVAPVSQAELNFYKTLAPVID